jgi:biotin operon repressor
MAIDFSALLGKAIAHYGIKRRSGRYPWGSGDDPEQRGKSFLGLVKSMEEKGAKEQDIAERLGITVTQLRNNKSVAKNAARASDAALALRLKDKGMSNVAIGKRMNLNESSVRALLSPTLKARADMIGNTANVLKTTAGKKGLVDVGGGVETHLGVTRNKLDAAVESLRMQGYEVFYIKTKQLGTAKNTYIKVLATPGMTYKEAYANRDKTKVVFANSEDQGRTFANVLKPIKNMDSSKVMIRYKEDGGSEKDGTIELRRGNKDLDLGKSSYAQVRIGVDGTHYMKGMAFYSDNVPSGYDVIYNTNKSRSTPKQKVFKEMNKDLDGRIDLEYPFGATIKPNGQKGYLNIVNEEGDWGNWSRTISSQVLSKQKPELAKRLLDQDLNRRLKDLDETLALTNPAVKRKLLMGLADEMDSAAVDLKASALPRQSSHVLIPVGSMKPTEVYAPNYKNGEKVVLIRHPHGGIFEIPELTVNNKNPEAKSILANALDAIGIHPKVASQLSGADFDGDSVLVIPNKNQLIKTAPQLKALSNFDPKESYPGYEGMTKMSKRAKQLQMGDVSNLITDMTIKGANFDEIARAVKHSMVVIDAEKHGLNYKQSAIDNGIAQLKQKYQGSKSGGAATLISKASSEKRVDLRKDAYDIGPKGEKIYKLDKDNVYRNKEGVLVKRQSKSTKLAEETDANKLSSGTKIEKVYADYANALKAAANKARLAMKGIEDIPYSPSANKTYKPEVDSLLAKLAIANRNRPLERSAQLIADSIFRQKKNAHPNLEPEDIKKLKGKALEAGRKIANAKKEKISITPKEWEAIQMGAISTNRLVKILDNTDMDLIKSYSMSKTSISIPPSKLLKARMMLSMNYTKAEVAEALGISTNKLNEALE